MWPRSENKSIHGWQRDAHFVDITKETQIGQEVQRVRARYSHKYAGIVGGVSERDVRQCPTISRTHRDDASWFYASRYANPASVQTDRRKQTLNRVNRNTALVPFFNRGKRGEFSDGNFQQFFSLCLVA
jgi:hypothetical protein